MDELKPSWDITVRLDGDDDAGVQTENFEFWLKEFLNESKVEGRIVAWEISRQFDG